MSSSSTFGDFQASVGRGSAILNIVRGVVFSVLLLIVAVVLVYGGATDHPRGTCKGGFCTEDKGACVSNPCGTPRKEPVMVFIGVGVALFAVLVVILSILWYHLVNRNRDVAIAGGTLAEAGALQGIFRGLSPQQSIIN